jgi:hypothetical protein
MRQRRQVRRSREQGIALVLAILSLMLLTFLGLTLAATTSTELQIATNYRWSQQALYNAEAGIEAGKALLSGMTWSSILPVARVGPAAPTVCTTPTCWLGNVTPTAAGGGIVPRFSARADAWGNPARNFESWQCDVKSNGAGYGLVLDDGTAEAPYQYKDVVFGQQLNGAFTLWIRRPVHYRSDGLFEDWGADDDNVILVSEGIAPFTGGPGDASTEGTLRKRSAMAVQVIEVALSHLPAVAVGGCGTRGGQAGGSPLGAGFDPCSNLTGGASVTAAMGGAATGTGAELNPNQ